MRTTLLLLTVLLARPLAAQDTGEQFKNGFRDIWHIWSSPARLNSDGARALGMVAAGTGAVMLVDEPIYRWLQENPDSPVLIVFKPFRENSPLSLLGRTFVLIGGGLAMFGLGNAFGSDGLQEAGMGCASAAASATVARGVMNHIIGRTRPRFQKGAFEFEFFHRDWNKRSLPGGHAAHIMSCVALWNERFDLGVAEPLLYATAAGVGWARVIDGAHWPSDTFIGQAYGYAIGKGIADRYAERAADDIVPAQTQVGIRFSIRF